MKLGEKVRNLRNHGLEEGVSTRLLIYAGTLIQRGVAPQQACDAAITRPITDDAGYATKHSRACESHFLNNHRAFLA